MGHLKGSAGHLNMFYVFQNPYICGVPSPLIGTGGALRKVHERGKAHVQALRRGQSKPVICTGVCLSEGPAKQTILGEGLEFLLLWYGSGCIGLKTPLLDSMTLSMTDSGQLWLRHEACKGENYVNSELDCCERCSTTLKKQKLLHCAFIFSVFQCVLVFSYFFHFFIVYHSCSSACAVAKV